MLYVEQLSTKEVVQHRYLLLVECILLKRYKENFSGMFIENVFMRSTTYSAKEHLALYLTKNVRKRIKKFLNVGKNK